MEDRIRQQAYFMWVDNGRTGDATYFWLAAEREVGAAIEKETAAVREDAGADSQATVQRLARRVNALVLLESEPEPDERALGIAAE
jgi:hypothetical protein